MSEYEVIKVLRKILIEGLRDFGINDVEVLKGYQPNPQGATTNSLNFFEVSSTRVGYPLKRDYFDEKMQQDMHEISQVVESVYQFNALVDNPANYTAADLIHTALVVLNSERAITAFNMHNMGIYHTTEIRNQYFKDFTDQNDVLPNFDIIIQYNRVFKTTRNNNMSVNFNFERI